MVARLSIDASDLKALSVRMKAEANGKALRKELIANLREAVAPAVGEVKGAVLGLPSSTPHAGRNLRSAIAAQARTQVRLSGRAPGVKVRVGTKGMPRGFDRGGRWTNRAGWTHPVFGRGRVTQSGRPGWFDNVFKGKTARYRRAVTRAMDATARRITRGH